MTARRLVPAALAGAAAALALDARPAAAQDAAPQRPKVIVLGFDGLDANRTEALMDAGRLPALAKLRAAGGYSRLRPTNPAQSPVSWAALTTGWNPGKTGIYDFLRRREIDPVTRAKIPGARLPAGPGSAPLLDPRQVTFAHADRDDTRPALPVSWRVALIAAAGALGAVTFGALAWSASRWKASLRRGRPFEIALTLGAALFACGGFTVLRWVPETAPRPVNLRSGTPFWVTLDRAGVRAVVLDAPLCFPPEEMHCGGCLAGLGVPDMQGTWGVYAVWSDDPEVPAETETAGAGMFVPADRETFDLVVAGPPNARLSPAQAAAHDRAARREKELRDASLEWTRYRRRESETREQILAWGRNLTASLAVTVRRGSGASVRLQDGREIPLEPGAWSDLLPVTFEMSPVVKLHGRLRLLLEDAGGPPPQQGLPPRPWRILAGQVQWDLGALPPNLPLTAPASFAEDLAALGPAETIGWPEMTNPVKDRMLGDRAFLDHVRLLLALRERRLADRIARGDWDCLFALFTEPDRVQHALYRHVDPQCPTHDPEAAKEFGGEIDRIYEEADRIVAETLARAPEGAVVIVCSDHGFAPFRRGVNLNNFLRMKGWQVRTGNDTPGNVATVGRAENFRDVDWPQTRAYAAGLGNVYLNLAGREPGGIVTEAKYDAVCAEITKDLLALRDADGAKVVRNVWRGRDIYHGARLREAPDLLVGFEWGYRVSWQGTLGKLDADVITPNTQRWSGDHCSVDPDLVPGVLFATAAVREDAAPKVEDVAAAVLSLYGLAADDPDGRSPLGR